MEELPDPLPPKLERLLVGHCTELEQLPELPSALLMLDVEGCSSLQELPDLSQCLVEHFWLQGCEALKQICVGGRTLHLG